jgi:LuxR family maltose regulon positive regulatory protein
VSIPLLSTKLYLPLSGSCQVERARLLDRLDECLRPGCRLALVSAPAGFGKTSLASAWVRAAQARHAGLAVAWLSLDEQDNDPLRFWTYVVAALQSAHPQLGTDAHKLLSAGQVGAADLIPTLLINDLARLTSPLVLALDDFHLIQQEPILQSLAFLLDRLPPGVHLLILTRTNPHLPLARFRSRGLLVEIRLADLRFSLEEAHEFLNAAMGLNLAPAPVETLNAKTEGWAAGLQMAGLAMRSMAAMQSMAAGEQGINAFIASFSGSHRFILDYLLEEVLNRQPPEIVDFLLKTSVLTHMCASLCDAVITDHSLQTDHFQQVLETLDHSNLFLISLDSDRRWFRYHQLFADLLRKRLRQVDPGVELELHARASRWYEKNGFPHQAVEHAFQTRDEARAGRLLAESGEAILKHGEYQWLLQWIGKLPKQQLQAHGVLYLYQATVYASVGQLNQAEQCLGEFETCQPAEQASLPLQDWLAGCAATVHALIAIFRGDTLASRQYARLALAAIPKGSDSPWRAHLLIALSHINRMDGNLDEARQNLVDAIEAGRLAGDIYMTLDATTHLVMMLCNQGQLRQAVDFARQGLDYIEQFGLGSSTEASMLFLAWGFLLCEEHRLEEAEDPIRRGLATCRQANIPGMLGWAYQVNTRYQIARQDWPSAEEAAREACQLAREVEIPAWIESGCAALRMQVWIQQGKLTEAGQFLSERGVIQTQERETADPEDRKIVDHDDRKIVDHLESAVLGRWLLAKGELDAAEKILQRLVELAEATGHRRMLILGLIDLALLHEARGSRALALHTLERAIELAEPEGYVQLFLDEGAALAGLLTAAVSQGQQAAFAGNLLTQAAAAQAGEDAQIGALEPGTLLPTSDLTGLSPREIEVLRLLAEGLANKEIAQRLYISLRTVKYHTTNIFTKLNVDNRTQAVMKAKKLGIL